jgi:hypothetical protein
MNLAPIALFVYNRPSHTKEAVTALLKNKDSAASDLFIFSDGAKNSEEQKNIDELRAYLKTITGFKTVNIIEQATNLGLANSIIAGVTKVVNQYGRIIVLEDDIIVHTAFLEYMNNGLQYFETNEKVASIHAYVYPLEQAVPDLFFLKGADCWGWATWKNRWELFQPNGVELSKELKVKNLISAFNFDNTYPYYKMLQDQIEGKNYSWAIRWHASCYLKGLLTLYPAKPLITNIGFDNSGTHCGDDDIYNSALHAGKIFNFNIEVVESKMAREAFKQFFSKTSFTNKIYSFPQKILQKIKQLIFSNKN